MKKRSIKIVFILILICLNKLSAQQINGGEIIAYKLKEKNTYDIADVYYFDYAVLLFPDSTYLVKSVTYQTKAEKREKRKQAQLYEGRWSFSPDSNMFVLFKEGIYNKDIFTNFVLKGKIAYQLPEEYKYMYNDLSHLIQWKKFKPSKKYIARLRRKLKERENDN